MIDYAFLGSVAQKSYRNSSNRGNKTPKNLKSIENLTSDNEEFIDLKINKCEQTQNLYFYSTEKVCLRKCKKILRLESVPLSTPSD